VDWRGELRKALAVQEVDRQLDGLRAERHRLLRDPGEIALEKDLLARRARIGAREAELAALERQQRLEDLERQTLETERERATRRLYGGEMKTARDAEGLQKNIDGAGRKVDELETSILQAMERAGGLHDQLTAERAALAAAEEVLHKRRHVNRVRLGEVDGHLPLLAARRQEEAGRVDPQVLREYERTRAGLGGIGLAAATGASCGACGFGMPAAAVVKLRDGVTPVRCEHCGRLLVDA